MKEVKRISFRNIAKGITIAACVIVIIVSCTTVGNNCFTKEAEPFVLIVNATDSTSKGELHVGETFIINSVIGGSSLGSTEDGRGYYCINIPIEFKGEHIDSITYSVNKGGFQAVEKKGASIISSGNEIDEIDAGQTGGCKGCEVKYYSELTLDYEEQSSETSWINIARDDTKYLLSGDKLTYQEMDEGYQELLDDVVITCDVNFDDGTTEIVELKVGYDISDMDFPKFTLERLI